MFGIPRCSYNRFSKKVLSVLKIANNKTCQRQVLSGALKKSTLQQTINSVKLNNAGCPHLLSIDEAEMLVASCDIKALHGLPTT